MEFVNVENYISKPDKIGDKGDLEFSDLGHYLFALDENNNYRTIFSLILELKQRLVTNNVESIKDHVSYYIPIIVSNIKIEKDYNKRYVMIGVLFKFMFFTRAIRCQGNRSRNQFYIIFDILKTNFYDELYALIYLIPHYGSFKDINTLMIRNYNDEKYKRKFAEIYSGALILDFQLIISPFDKSEDVSKLTKRVDQVNENLKSMTTSQINDFMKEKSITLSLASKWVPSCNKKDSMIRTDIISHLWPLLDCSKKRNLKLGDMALRKILTVLRQCCKVKEQNMTDSDISRTWKDILPEEVPSKAVTKYSKAFLNLTRDGKTRSENQDRINCAENFKKAIQDFKIKGAQSDLKNLADIIWDDIINNKKSQIEKDLIDVQFKKMIQNVKNLVLEKYNSDIKEATENNLDVTSIKDPRCVIPVIDVSGSMFHAKVGHYAICLGIVCSSISKIPGKIITFSTKPEIIDFDLNANIFDTFRFLKDIDWAGSTNIDATYGLVLDIMRKEKELGNSLINDLSILYLTDGQFDSLVVTEHSERFDIYVETKTLSLDKFDTFLDRKRSAFESSDFKLPMTIFWNLNTGLTHGFPAQSFTEGVKLVAGLSQTIMVEVMTGLLTQEKDNIDETSASAAVTPLESFFKTLSDKSFDPVNEGLKMFVISSSDED